MKQPLQKTLSLVVMGKNEARAIAGCLRPWRGIASEILYCDTGSRDGTQRIAARNGAVVWRHPWCGDFSRIRNFLLAKARGEWVLCLDADERIAERDLGKLREALHADYDAFVLPRRNYVPLPPVLWNWAPARGEYPDEETFAGTPGYYETRRVCLFRNLKAIHYSFPVHESVLPSLESAGLRIGHLDLPVHHFELQRGWRHHRRKHRAYLALERRALRSLSGDSPYAAAFRRGLVLDLLGSGELSDHARAERISRQLLSSSRRGAEDRRVAALCAAIGARPREVLRRLPRLPAAENTAADCILRGRAYLELGRDRDALDRLHDASRRFPDHPLVRGLYGAALLRAGRFRASIRECDRALALQPAARDWLVNRGSAHLALGDRELAERDYRASLTLAPDKEIERLLEQMRRAGRSSS